MVCHDQLATHADGLRARVEVVVVFLFESFLLENDGGAKKTG